MSRYRDTACLADLLRPDQVHADLYTDPELFELERERLLMRTWQYVGHSSQVPATGDFYTADIAGQPVLMLRQTDGSVSVLLNRCAHKGSTVLSQRCGNAGKMLRCPYHAWTYRLDGTLISMPLRAEYEHTDIAQCEASKGMTRVASANYRGFVFARIGAGGPSFEDYAGDMLRVLDNLVDRAPGGEIAVSGGCIRSTIRCNWKMYLENVNDAVHAIATHESVVATASDLHDACDDKADVPMALAQLLPFGSGLESVRDMGARVFANGHSILGTRASLHSSYASLQGYEAALAAVHGTDRAREILSFSPQNAIVFPSLALKCSPQLLRVVRPVAVDCTIVEAWSLRLKDAPDELLERTQHYNRLVYSPMSPVAHDDIHVFEGMQRSLKARRNRWVSLHRLHDIEEQADSGADHSATSEILMRNQFRAWLQWMSASEPPPAQA